MHMIEKAIYTYCRKYYLCFCFRLQSSKCAVDPWAAIYKHHSYAENVSFSSCINKEVLDISNFSYY